MTNKDQLQKELKAKVKLGIKPSHLRKSKSLGAISPVPLLPTVPLQKSQSQLVIPVLNEPSPEQQISQLQEQVKFQAQTSQNYLQNLQLAQAKITDLETELKTKTNKEKVQISQLEQQILELRLDKIKDFGDYYQKKQDLAAELELNITEGTSEINLLESKLLATNKKKLELQQKLSQEQLKNTKLELKLINHEESLPSFNYWPWLVMMVLFSLSLWLLTITN